MIFNYRDYTIIGIDDIYFFFFRLIMIFFLRLIGIMDENMEAKIL